MSPDEAEGFYEEDEEPAKVWAAFEAGPHGITARPVTITYDREVRAAYVCLGARSPGRSVRQQQLDNSTIIDYAADGRVIGVELLGVALPVIASPDPLT